jgi:tetratricopeptide (TPR) repeat protein
MAARQALGKTKKKLQILLGARQVEEAMRVAESIYRKHADSHDAALMLGEVYTSCGRFLQASRHYSRLLSVFPDSAELAYRAGLAFASQGRHRDAEHCLCRAAELDSKRTDVLCELAVAVVQAGDEVRATSILHQCLTLHSGHARACYLLGNIHLRGNNLSEAMEMYRRVLASDKNHFGAAYNLALALHKNGENAHSIETYKLCIRLNRSHIESYVNLASLLMQAGNHAEAEEYLHKALKIDGRNVHASLSLVAVLREMDRIAEAKTVCRRVLEIAPTNAQAHGCMADIMLFSGDFGSGWREYEWRVHCEGVFPRNFGFRFWDGADLNGGALLVVAEQGIGDEVMFSSCFPDLIAGGVRMVVDCDPRLEGIFKRSFPGVVVHGGRKEDSREWISEYPEIGAECMMGSLPKHLRQSPESFAVRGSYLVPDLELKEAWRSKLTELGEGMKVGISWVAGRNSEAQRKRSISLSQWMDILGTEHCDFVSLQYGGRTEEICTVNDSLSGCSVTQYAEVEPLVELENFLALVSNLDLVISVDNSTVHFAGALGVPTWVLLPFAPEWRWMSGGDVSLWYSSVKLFRQSGTCGDWTGLIREVSTALDTFVDGRNPK